MVIFSKNLQLAPLLFGARECKYVRSLSIIIINCVFLYSAGEMFKNFLFNYLSYNQAKAEEKEDEKPTMKEKLVALAKAEEKSRKNRAREVDSHCSLAGAEVWIDFDCMLNQTNIGNNNNKFYVIQLLTVGKKFYVWNRWGRVVSISIVESC